MSSISITTQKIFNKKREVFAYELVFKDNSDEITSLSDSIKETSRLIISSVTSSKLDNLLGRGALAFINVDEAALSKGILDVLDKERFVLNILEDINLDDEIINKIIQYRKRGFRLSLEHFDSSASMIQKFKRLFNYIDIIKMDIVLSQEQNLLKVMKKFQGTRVKLLAQNIETQQDYIKYQKMGFDLFQGYFLDKPNLVEIAASKEAARLIILQLLKIIKEDNTTNEKLEFFIKKQPDLSYKLIQFFNNSKRINVKVESLPQVITLMGRQMLLRWLLVYLYSEVSQSSASQTMLELALKRAENMEAEADEKNKDKAYLAGMFSMLGSIFEMSVQELMKHVNMDPDITALVLEKKGIFASSLMRAERAEKEYLKKLYLQNFENLYTGDLISTLESNGVEIDKDKI